MSGQEGDTSVVSLVQQLKAGKMSKDELFERLSKIQKAKKAPGAGGGAATKESAEPPISSALETSDHYRTMPGASAETRTSDREVRTSYSGGRAENWGEERDQEVPQLRQATEEEVLLRKARQQYGTGAASEQPRNTQQTAAALAPQTETAATAATVRAQLRQSSAQHDKENRWAGFGGGEEEDHVAELRGSYGWDRDDEDAGGERRGAGGVASRERVGDSRPREPTLHSAAGPRARHGGGAREGGRGDEGRAAGGGGSGGRARPQSAPSSRRGTLLGGKGHSASPRARPGSAAGGVGGAGGGGGGGGGERRYASPVPGGATEFKAFAFATDRRGMDRRRQSRMAVIERERQEQCTFRPQTSRWSQPNYMVQGSPAGGAADIYRRHLAWQQRKEEEIERLREQVEQEEGEECTFQPNVSATQRHNESAASVPSSRRSAGPQQVSERLYQFGVEHKRQVQSALRARLKDEMEKICTFRPRVNPAGRRDPTPVRSKYRDPSPRRESSYEETETLREALALKECTFRPRINHPSKHMQTAIQYLQEPAWLRLSRPRPVTPQASAESFSQPPQRAPSPTIGASASLRPAPRRAQTPPPGHVARREASGEVRGEMSLSFDDFLQRQEQFVHKMQLHISQRRLSADAAHRKPAMCPMSQRIVERKKRVDSSLSGSFLDRLQVNIEKKQESINQVRERVEQDLTFRPAINKTSRDLKSRSVRDLSGGDLQRQNLSTASVRRSKELEDSDVFTFKPKLNVVPGVQSRLKVSSDPDNYLSRVEHEQRLAQRQQIKNAQELLDKELKECTFKPVINEAPAYVKKIANSQKRKKLMDGHFGMGQGSLENINSGWDSSVAVPHGPQVTLPNRPSVRVNNKPQSAAGNL